MKVYCKACHTVLTLNLQRLACSSLTCEEDGKPYIPQGYYLISDGMFFTNTSGKIIIHLNDLINTTPHWDSNRRKGCCGVSGTEGPNRICHCNHEVASEYSDCWIPHAILFEKTAVYPMDY